MPKTTFGSGTIVTPAWFNAQQNLIFDGQDLDGHQAKLTDASLSDDSNQIKSRFSAIADEFKVSLQSQQGLYIKVAAGRFKNAQQEIFDITETVILTQNNAVNYVYINSSGDIIVDVFLPAGVMLLAVVSTSGGNISSISDRRARFIEPAGASPAAGDYGNAIATLQYVKQSLLATFFGVNVPEFTITTNSVSWTDGMAIFDGANHAIEEGTHTFISSNSGWFHLWAEDNGADAIIVVSNSAPTLATQQLWWHLDLNLGSIRQAIPAKPGFGV